MSLRSIQHAAAAFTAALLLSATVTAQVVVESDQSDPRVVMTQALESYGIGMQDAHMVAVLAEDGVLLPQEEETCTVHLVTIWWCEMVNGQSVQKVLRTRFEASCFDTFFSPDNPCSGFVCPPGTRPMYRMLTGSGNCFGIPQQTCVQIEVSGPIESTCDWFPECSCLPALQQSMCEDVVDCVPVVPPSGPNGLSPPVGCPSCAE